MNKTSKGTLYLLPTLLGDVEPLEVLPLAVKKVLDSTDFFIVENEKTARHFIKRVLPSKSQPDLKLFVLNKFTDPKELTRFIEPLEKGHSMGLLSEAGAPGVADPGADIVSLAHHRSIRVVPVVGPSSILLALMASGLNGQNFAFSGYLPIEKDARKRKIKSLESLSKSKSQTQIFMETPYRNMKLVKDLFDTLAPSTMLCIATDITMPTEFIQTHSIAHWRNHVPDIHKRPTMFIIQA
ncbi:MAG: SAM-dependent methyltransferase [Schleiferiaceae bacterium]|nr:SAM-dependent methyltransferase [Schleiferiaceae bacterium]